MPVSHVALTVSHLPSATSFFSAALQPLGYRYIGKQGESIGFGVDSADFFITQAPYHTNFAPNHVAFLADDYVIVQDCYDAALRAGARPSGSPSHRNDDCSCYNAAVEDYDGNTIEFIFRQPHHHSHSGSTTSPSSYSASSSSRRRSEVGDGSRSSASRDHSSNDGMSQAKSRLQTVMDLASSVKSHTSSDKPSGLIRSFTDPIQRVASDMGSKAIIGTVLGAAAGAAIAYAMVKSEDDPSSSSSSSQSRPKLARAETLPASVAPISARKSHRNYSTTESAVPSRRSPLAIEAHAHDDVDIRDIMSRASRRNAPSSASHTPVKESTRQAPSRASHHDLPPESASLHRARTMPVDAEARSSHTTRDSPPTRHDSHRSRHDSVTSSHHDSPTSARRSSHLGSQASTLKPSPSQKSTTRSTTTAINPAQIPIPPSTRASSRVDTTPHHPAAIPLPPSRTGTSTTTTTTSSRPKHRTHSTSASHRSSHRSSHPPVPQIPTPYINPNTVLPALPLDDGDNDTGLLLHLDTTVRPDDSISCVGWNPPPRPPPPASQVISARGGKQRSRKAGPPPLSYVAPRTERGGDGRGGRRSASVDGYRSRGRREEEESRGRARSRDGRGSVGGGMISGAWGLGREFLKRRGELERVEREEEEKAVRDSERGGREGRVVWGVRRV